MFYIKKDNKIVLFDENGETLQNTIDFIPEYRDLEIQKTDENHTIVDFELVTIDEAEQKEAQKEREKLDVLSLTAADVERAIYKVKGMDFEDLIEMLRENPPMGLDIKALKIELKANHFYRGNPYVNALGAVLGFTSEQLDEFFKTGDYTKLMENKGGA